MANLNVTVTSYTRHEREAEKYATGSHTVRILIYLCSRTEHTPRLFRIYVAERVGRVSGGEANVWATCRYMTFRTVRPRVSSAVVSTYWKCPARWLQLSGSTELRCPRCQICSRTQRLNIDGRNVELCLLCSGLKCRMVNLCSFSRRVQRHDMINRPAAAGKETMVARGFGDHYHLSSCMTRRERVG